MKEEKTTRERVSDLEDKFKGMMDILVDNNKDLTGDIVDLKNSITALSKNLSDMAPIIEEIVLVKGYGGFAWRVTKQLGIWTLAIMASWGIFKDHIKHFLHYIFN